MSLQKHEEQNSKRLWTSEILLFLPELGSARKTSLLSCHCWCCCCPNNEGFSNSHHSDVKGDLSLLPDAVRM